jgi:signal transduction histidine kinase/ActR/RegA family two-component response regulator
VGARVVQDPTEQQDTLARLRMAGGTGTIIAAAMLGIAALLRVVWRVPIPLAAFGAGLILLAGDVWLSRITPQASRESLERINFFHYLFDALLITFVINELGGADWLGAFFYLFVILHANITLRRTHGLILTAVCMAAFVSSMLMAYHGLLPAPPIFPQRALVVRDPKYVAVIILVVGIGGLLVFSLAFARFAEVLRGKTDELHEANVHLREAAVRLEGHRDELERAVETRTRDLMTALGHLRSAHEELKRLDQLKTSFLANVSHELRTPLTSIRSFAEILQQFPDEESAEREEFLQIIASESDRLARLIEDVLDITKIESGHIDWSFSSVELPSLLSFCVRTVAPLAEAKGLALRLEVPPDLPAVRADRDRIAQVLNNLLSNALKFTDAGAITVGARNGGDHVLVYVQDTGPGVPAFERELIFKKFHQVTEGLTGKPSGSGLGLAISAEILTSHNGRIWVEEAPGGGSLFQFRLPLAGPEPGPAAVAERRRGKAVLVADRDAITRSEYRQALERVGYRVKEAADGREVLRMASLSPPDVICIDVLTPDMGGLAVLRTLRASKDTRRIPVIIVSVMEEKDWALQFGAACHLVKPMAADELVAAVAGALATGGRAETGGSTDAAPPPRRSDA